MPITTEPCASLCIILHSHLTSRSQLSTPWDKASSRTQSYYRKQTYELVKELVELIAPQQSEVLLTEIMQKHFQSDSDHDDYFNSMVASYQEAGSPFLKKQILSLFANEYPRETLLTAIPGLTKHKIDSAMKYATVTDLISLTTTYQSLQSSKWTKFSTSSASFLSLSLSKM